MVPRRSKLTAGWICLLLMWISFRQPRSPDDPPGFLVPKRFVRAPKNRYSPLAHTWGKEKKPVFMADQDETPIAGSRAQAVFDFLLALQGGSFIQDVADYLDRAKSATVDVQKPATVTLTLTLKPVTKHDPHQLFITAAVSAKLPQTDNEPEIFFDAGQGKMPSRRDERQYTFEFPRPQVIVNNEPAQTLTEDTELG